MRFRPEREVTDDVIVTEARLLYIIRDLPLGSKPRSRVPPVPNLYLEKCIVCSSKGGRELALHHPGSASAQNSKHTYQLWEWNGQVG